MAVKIVRAGAGYGRGQAGDQLLSLHRILDEDKFLKCRT